jgi:hypothetical protein
MKPKTEIYKLKFDRYTDKDGVQHWALYVVGQAGYMYGELVTPESIKLSFDKIIVTYNDGRTHEFKHTDDCEIFRRPIKDEEEVAD